MRVIVDLKKLLLDRYKDEHGMTIVEVLVAFVLVLLAIAMMASATSMATKIQKKTKDVQKQTAVLAEQAYKKMQPVYDETEKCWKIILDPASVTVGPEINLKFQEVGNPSSSFELATHTAEWTVSSGASIQTKYRIYQ